MRSKRAIPKRVLKDYLACPTIEEYLLVEAQSLSIEIYQKEGQKWVYKMFKANDEIELTSLGVHFPLTAAYVDVDFEEETFSVEGNIYQADS